MRNIAKTFSGALAACVLLTASYSVQRSAGRLETTHPAFEDSIAH